MPYVLVVLVAFFAGRYVLEWLQLDHERRQVPAARVDFWLTHFVAVASILVFLADRLLAVEIGRGLEPTLVGYFAVGLAGGVLLFEVYRYWTERESNRVRLTAYFTVLVALVVAVAVLPKAGWSSWTGLAAGMVTGWVFARVSWRGIRKGEA